MVGGTADPGLRSGTLAGRQAECEVIAQALGRLADGRSQVVELTGDPGIGKTRLLTELARQAAERGFGVLDGRAQHNGERVPFYALVDALDDYLAGLDLWGLEADRDVLASIFPSLRRPGMENAGAACERYRLFRAVRVLLESLASPALVLLLDDMQWADEDTAELVAQLLCQPPRRPVLVALAYRWRQAPGRLRAAVATARGDDPPACLRLGPLSEAEAELMLSGRGSRSWRRAIYRASGGNPFYLDALARQAQAQGPADGEPGNTADPRRAGGRPPAGGGPVGRCGRGHRAPAGPAGMHRARPAGPGPGRGRYRSRNGIRLRRRRARRAERRRHGPGRRPRGAGERRGAGRPRQPRPGFRPGPGGPVGLRVLRRRARGQLPAHLAGG
jgi:hypothetical protein